MNVYTDIPGRGFKFKNSAASCIFTSKYNYNYNNVKQLTTRVGTANMEFLRQKKQTCG
jgi:hypothetical protein